MTADSGIGSDALFRFSSICLKITCRQTPTVWHQSRRQFTVTKRPKKSQQILIKITGTCNYFDQAKLGVTTAPLRDDDDDNLLIGKLSETLCQSKKNTRKGLVWRPQRCVFNRQSATGQASARLEHSAEICHHDTEKLFSLEGRSGALARDSHGGRLRFGLQVAVRQALTA